MNIYMLWLHGQGEHMVGDKILLKCWFKFGPAIKIKARTVAGRGKKRPLRVCESGFDTLANFPAIPT